MRNSVRAVLVGIGVCMMAAGGLAAATPASAGTWSGTLSCPGSTFVKATGYKGGTGPITLSAAGHSYTDSTTKKGYSLELVGAYATGSWKVTGAGATSGFGSCGI